MPKSENSLRKNSFILLIKTCRAEYSSTLNLGENTEPVIETAGMDKLPFSSQILNFFRFFVLKITTYIASLFSIGV